MRSNKQFADDMLERMAKAEGRSKVEILRRAIGLYSDPDAPAVNPSPQSAGWVPVAERLPSHYDYVLIWCDDGTAEAGVHAIDCRINGEWSRYSHVTHWMPLPDAPNNQNTEQDA